MNVRLFFFYFLLCLTFCLGFILCIPPYLTYDGLKDWANGQSLVIRSRVGDLIQLPETRFIQRRFTVFNRTSIAHRLLGSQADCGCLFVEPMPIKIESGQSATFTISTTRKAGYICSITVFTSDPSMPNLSLDITGLPIKHNNP